jgi:quercetin dioxygenase-like cupin family protein
MVKTSDLFGKAAELASLLDYQDEAVVSREIIKKDTGTITLFAFDAGQGLSEHTAPYDAFVYMVDGSAEIKIADTVSTVGTGQVIILPANVPHSLQAEKRFKLLLVMIRSTS